MAENNNNTRQERPRAGKAALVWLVIFLFIGALLIFRTPSSDKPQVLPQSEFETLLAKGDILEAAVTPESPRVLNIEGKFSIRTGAGEKTPQKKVSFRTRVLDSDRLDAQLVKVPKMNVESGNDNWWALIISVLPVLLVLIVIYIFTSRQIRQAGRGAMDFGKSRARMVMPDQLNVKFDDIAGADEAKEEIKEIVDYLKDPLKFQMVGGKIPKGCLLVGSPGTGKTLLAKAVACEAGVPFFTISGSDFVEMFVGVGASRVRDMFEEARKNTPCLLFIDEIDAVGRSRFSGWGGGHDEREQTLNALLVEMDGLESNRAGVIVLAATNRPDILDPALQRPGRFDRQIYVDLPSLKGREEILALHGAKIKFAEDADLSRIARGTPGFSGADLANLLNEAALLAVRKNLDGVTQEMLEEARDKVLWGRERKSANLTDKDRETTAWHEAGHALLQLLLPNADPLHKVTIIPRGRALGATMALPEKDILNRTRGYFIDEMCICCGGRIAEKIKTGDISTGAAQDIKQATSIARDMICSYGMSDTYGFQAFVEPSQFSAEPLPPPFSQKTAEGIDAEVKKLVDDAYARAEKLINENRDKLETLAAALLEKESMDGRDIEELLGLEKKQ